MTHAPCQPRVSTAVSALPAAGFAGKGERMPEPERHPLTERPLQPRASIARTRTVSLPHNSAPPGLLWEGRSPLRPRASCQNAFGNPLGPVEYCASLRPVSSDLTSDLCPLPPARFAGEGEQMPEPERHPLTERTLQPRTSVAQ